MKKISYLLFSVALIGLTSCLKDGKVNLAPGASPAVIEWSTAVVDLAPQVSVSGSPYTLYAGSYAAVAAATQAFQVGYTGGGTAPSDITVSIGASSTALAAYNAANFGTASTANYFTELPSSLYTLPATVTIPAGSNKAAVTLTMNTLGFDFSKKYAIPLTIKSVSGASVPISGNYGTIIMAVSAKNKYDGLWTVTGTMVDNGSAANTGKYPTDYYLETQTATSVAMFDFGYSGTFGHQILGSGAQSYYGTYAPVFDFNASNAVTSVVNYWGQPAANGRSAAIDPSGQNKFISGTPGTVGAQFQCSYFMYQPSVVAVGPRVTFNETFTYKGPRP